MNLKVISFNIRCKGDPGGNSIEERAPRLHAVTSPYDADLIGFQEFTPNWQKHINKYYGDDYDMFNKYRSANAEQESAPILWKKDKFECTDKGYFWFSDTPEVESKGWDERYDCYRMCEYVILKHRESGKGITFMNTHFGFGDNGQSASARLLYDYSRKISDNPTFITGDFNMTPYSPAYAVMTEYFTDVNAVTANDMRDTFHDYDPSVQRNAHIDYCFVDGSVTPVSQRIIDEAADGKYPSDHFGLYIELKI